LRLTNPEGAPAPPPTRRGAIASLFTAGYALSMQPAQATAITTPSDGLRIDEEVRIFGHEGDAVPAYLARPRLAGRRSAIVVVNEIFGIHEYIKDVCRRLAHAGYVALAPDYFDRAGDPATVTDMNEIRRIVAATPSEQVMGDTGGAMDWLRGHRFVRDRNLGITGFCWGGAVVWQACARLDFRAGVAWYGRLTAPPAGGFGAEEGRRWPVDLASELHAPVLGLYGERDTGIPLEQVEAMRAALAANGNPTRSEIVVYPGAEHGFHADYRPTYNEAAATDAWGRMLAHFRANGLRGRA